MNSKHSVYYSYHFFIKRLEEIWCIIFILKAITILTSNEARLDYKKNYRYYKLANFWLDTIRKFNFTLLVIILYTLLKLSLRNILPIWRVFE